MVALYKDPRGERIFEKSTPTVASCSTFISAHKIKHSENLIISNVIQPPTEYETLEVKMYIH